MSTTGTTGATDAQIEAAYRRHPLWEKLSKFKEAREEMQIRIDDAAPCLVPPGMVIASAADVAKVPTAEELSAIAWFVNEDYEGDVTSDYCAEWDANAAIVRAYLERVTE